MGTGETARNQNLAQTSIGASLLLLLLNWEQQCHLWIWMINRTAGIECPWCSTYGLYLDMAQLSPGQPGKAGSWDLESIPAVAELLSSPAGWGCGHTHLPLQSSNFVNIIEVLQAAISEEKRRSRTSLPHTDTQPLLPHLPTAMFHRKMDIVWGPALSQGPHLQRPDCLYPPGARMTQSLKSALTTSALRGAEASRE